ncbi:epsilon subunit of F1F0-ATP synthase N-terminal domain-containing protein [Atractiella rhizophila]|nr:epsilon subunit of F1F0-ATP synthase N-terminal domain-containing protein [Atractiella rhizophila]
MLSRFALRAVPKTSKGLSLRNPVSLGAKRFYAEESGKLKLSLVLPHETIFSSQDVVQVNVAAGSGDMGILANHVPVIEPLKPGIVEVIEGSAADSKKWFVSGGFANVHPNNTLTINAIEAFPLTDFSPELEHPKEGRKYVKMK